MEPGSQALYRRKGGGSNTLPKVSIGLPVYNGEKFLVQAIESVLAQEFEDFELLISDNASNDSTWEICRHYADLDHRIRLNRNDHNIGAIANFEFVLKKSTGRYFAWTAHDDLLHPRFLYRCVNFLDNHPDHVVCSVRHVIIAYETGQELYSQWIDQTWDSDDLVERYEECLETGGWPIAIYGLMRREAVERTALARTWAGDVMFLRELCLQGKFYQINEVLRYYRSSVPCLERTSNQGSFWAEMLYGPGKQREFFPWVRAYSGLIGRLMRKSLPFKTKTSIVYLTILKSPFVRFRLLYWDLVSLIRDLTYDFPVVYRFLRRIRYRIEPRHWRSWFTQFRQ
jgi:glycosyltransferase involved in cell wall biosynthesis